MKILFSFIVWLGLFTSGVCHASEMVHYVGFNKFDDSNSRASAKAFDAYIEDLLPIMARYHMVLEVYTVVHGGGDNLDADVLTFGTAPSMESFQAFFQDADLQQIMPNLVGALSAHQVVFTAGDFMPGNESRDHLMLQLDWLKDQAGGVAVYEEKLSGYGPVTEKYGVTREASTAGIMSNRGLAAEVVEVEAPQAMVLWRMRDAHGFFDDPLVVNTNREIGELISRSEAFWLKPRIYK